MLGALTGAVDLPSLRHERTTEPPRTLLGQAQEG
jgi:hypothetical protein